MSAKIDWIKTQIPLVDNFGDLNTPSWVANPVPTSVVPKPIVLAEAMALMTPQEAYAVAESHTYDRILDALNQGRLDWVADNLSVLHGANVISDATMQALGGLMKETITIQNPQIFKTPAELAGYDAVSLQEWNEAIA